VKWGSVKWVVGESFVGEMYPNRTDGTEGLKRLIGYTKRLPWNINKDYVSRTNQKEPTKRRIQMDKNAN
jgi:hypothetical protein